MSRELADLSEQSPPKTLEEVAYKCFLNDKEVPCRNMSFSVPSHCKPKTVEGVRTSSMSCMLGTPQRLESVMERLEKGSKTRGL
jgi:hypothetical protein